MERCWQYRVCHGNNRLRLYSRRSKKDSIFQTQEHQPAEYVLQNRHRPEMVHRIRQTAYLGISPLTYPFLYSKAHKYLSIKIVLCLLRTSIYCSIIYASEHTYGHMSRNLQYVFSSFLRITSFFSIILKINGLV